MKVNYHADIDALRIVLKSKSELSTDEESKAETIKIGHDIIISIGHDGDLQSIEILQASQHMDDVEHLTASGLFVKSEPLKI